MDDLQLPPKMHMSRGKYYYVCSGVKRKWLPLGSDFESALHSYQKHAVFIEKGFDKDMVRTLFSNAKKGAKQRRIEFMLTLEDVQNLCNSSFLRCAVTGIPFSPTKPAGCRIAPWSPSLDRRDATRGYHPDNLRLVCKAVNFAMGQWGDEILYTLAIAALKNRKRAKKIALAS